MNRPNGEAGTGDTGVAGRATQALTGAAGTITKYGTNTGTTAITTSFKADQLTEADLIVESLVGLELEQLEKLCNS